MVEGWPNHIPFKNLCEASSALPELKSLLEQWQDQRIHWKKLSDEEAKCIFEEHREQGEVPEATHQARSDRGKKRKCPSTASAVSDQDASEEEAVSTRTQKRQKITSAAAVDSGDEYDDDEEYY